MPEKVEDSLLEMNSLVVLLAESYTGIELNFCLLGVWHPGREDVTSELSITGFTSKSLMLVPRDCLLCNSLLLCVVGAMSSCSVRKFLST